jgi:hypothetical protein
MYRLWGAVPGSDKALGKVRIAQYIVADGEEWMQIQTLARCPNNRNPIGLFVLRRTVSQDLNLGE